MAGRSAGLVGSMETLQDGAFRVILGGSINEHELDSESRAVLVTTESRPERRTKDPAEAPRGKGTRNLPPPEKKTPRTMADWGGEPLALPGEQTSDTGIPGVIVPDRIRARQSNESPAGPTGTNFEMYARGVSFWWNWCSSSIWGYRILDPCATSRSKTDVRGRREVPKTRLRTSRKSARPSNLRSAPFKVTPGMRISDAFRASA